ncbi:hypothetical protein ACFQ48_05625 [Hymenobacter caeli]|uniref:Uncharacterized protein n=1 Tax=Hymenobacter caeli TaxID=2735894 RepID=A0ABX2FNQ9_9BACT|nr:hypothetical protein [Hymenobacter caeli]NRT18641.1 hypothetical protein [Hymenobacter caeli]
MKTPLLCCLCFALLLSNKALGQAVGPDSSALAALGQRYAAARGAESRLYNGPAYAGHIEPFVKGQPFFESSAAQPATVDYDGHTYTGVPLHYDLVLGQLVLQVPPGFTEMHLLNEKVARFTLAGHTFIRLVTDSAGASVPTGFYDLLVEGPVRVLAARRKNVQTRATFEGMQGEISQINEVFIYKDRQYYLVGNAKELLRLFPESKGALRAYIRAQKLTFKAASREPSIAAVVRYYATLAPPPAANTP